MTTSMQIAHAANAAAARMIVDELPATIDRHFPVEPAAYPLLDLIAEAHTEIDSFLGWVWGRSDA
jgi:hypothetical protein